MKNPMTAQKSSLHDVWELKGNKLPDRPPPEQRAGKKKTRRWQGNSHTRVHNLVLRLSQMPDTPTVGGDGGCQYAKKTGWAWGNKRITYPPLK